MSECLWAPCEQDVVGDSELCYFHSKRGLGLITGDVPGAGMATYREPPPRVKDLIAALDKEEDE